MPEDNFFKIIDQRTTDSSGNAIDPKKLRERLNHPQCVACQEAYRKKFPGKPFRIVCDGVYTDAEYQEIALQTGSTLHEIKEVMDRAYWAKNHYKVPDESGDMRPFIAREYQIEQLRCTAERKVDRWSRGLGKTTIAEITEIHTALNRKNYPILILCPAKHQAKKWFDELVAIFESDPALRKTLISKSQSPFYQLKLSQGSTLSIFTAGSKSGRSADSVRSVSPRRIRLEEQDLLNDKDYAAVSPLLRRYKSVEFGGSSTPLGKRETFWEMCVKYPDYKEFHFPIQRHPEFTEEMEENCRREARTEIRFTHEFMAEFGDQEAGVFKAVYVDASRQPYIYKEETYDSNLRYWLGCDWNGQGTGTRIRIVAFNPATGKRRVVDSLTIDESHEASVRAIFRMNAKWHCEGAVTDAGHGGMENEEIKRRAAASKDPDDRHLIHVQVIDFGAKLKTNKLVPKRRSDGVKPAEEELQRSTKPFMVEGAAMCIEGGLFEYSNQDTVLDEQLRAYHVKTWSQHGWANTYASGNVGDHDLDAAMLALLGIELRYGLLYQKAARPQTAASLSLHSGFGSQSVQVPLFDRSGVGDKRAAEKSAAGVPSRLMATAGRIAAMQRGSAFVVKGTPELGRSLSPTGQAPSRTTPFTGRGRTPGYGGNRDGRGFRRYPL